MTCGTEPFSAFHLKNRCQNSPHLCEFNEHKQIIPEGQSSYGLLEWTFIKVSTSFSETVNNGEEGCFGFIPLFLSGNLQCIPIYTNSLTLERSVPFLFWFFLFLKEFTPESQLHYCFRGMTRGSESKGKSRNWIYMQWWWSNANEEDIKPNNSLSIGLVIADILQPVSLMIDFGVKGGTSCDWNSSMTLSKVNSFPSLKVRSVK